MRQRAAPELFQQCARRADYISRPRSDQQQVPRDLAISFRLPVSLSARNGRWDVQPQVLAIDYLESAGEESANPTEAWAVGGTRNGTGVTLHRVLLPLPGNSPLSGVARFGESRCTALT